MDSDTTSARVKGFHNSKHDHECEIAVSLKSGTAEVPTEATVELVSLWNHTDSVFGLLKDEDAFLQRPITQRHPFLFYLGHVTAFTWSKLLTQLPNANEQLSFLDQLFERGMDPHVQTGEVTQSSGTFSEPPTGWPELSKVREYVRQRRQKILENVHHFSPYLLHMAMEHEMMHQETLLYMLFQLDTRHIHIHPDIQLPLYPSPPQEAPVQKWISVPSSNVRLGVDFEGFGHGQYRWDNEYGNSTVHVTGFQIQSLQVTNGDFLEFMECGGYLDSTLWDPLDWQWLQSRDCCPALWKQEKGKWKYRMIHRWIPLSDALDLPVYVSHAEANAFAQWKDARLPTEAEWVHASEGSELGHTHFKSWGPIKVGGPPSFHGVHGMFGNGWEWTSSVFEPFPGFIPSPEYPGYSADFFDKDHNVLRGCSWATDKALCRLSMRNWYRRQYPYMFATFRCVRNETSGNRFALDVIAGLSASSKHISSKYLYDEKGSQIYEQIETLEEYYPIRLETAMLEDNASSLSSFLASNWPNWFNVIEFGAGDGKKTRILLNSLLADKLQFTYIPIDISPTAIHIDGAKEQFEVAPFAGDNIDGLKWAVNRSKAGTPNLILFLGSSIGNHTPSKANAFLRTVSKSLNPGDLLFMGADTEKDIQVLLNAYSDRKGVTKQFNLNLLDRCNRELGANFDKEKWDHRAHYNSDIKALESHLISKSKQDIHFASLGRTISMDTDEVVLTEYSCKYTVARLREMAACSGFQEVDVWQSNPPNWFLDVIWKKV